MQTIFVEPKRTHSNETPPFRQTSLLVPTFRPPGAGRGVTRKPPAVKGKASVAALVENGNGNRAMVAVLAGSKMYREFERAFNDLTGLPVALQPVEAWQLPHHGRRNENPFCALMAQKSRSCAHCLQMQGRLCERAGGGPRTVDCPSGLSDTAVPLRLNDKLIGFLQTGQLFRRKPSPSRFDRVARLAAKWGVDAPRAELKEAYFSGKVVSAPQHAAAVRLLSVFAQHLAVVSNQLMIQQENAELPIVARAKEYIFEHQAEKLRLSQVAKAVHMSTFYFCKTFKKAAGINFTNYLSRVRIERAKNLLLNPNLRVSEIAYEVGFQSLTHFNRVFRKIAAQSPTHYREQLLAV